MRLPCTCVYWTDQFHDVDCEASGFIDEINYDEFGNRLGVPPSSEGGYEFDPNVARFVVTRHREPTIGGWLNKDGTITPPPLPPA